MTKDQENKSLFNVPNILSAYRLCAAPILVLSLWYRAENVFITLIILNLLTDILDGLIARAFLLQSDFGAKLDSYGDITTYFLSIAGIFTFRYQYLSDHTVPLACLLGSYFTPQLLSLIKFGSPTSMHLYSSKICGYVEGAFLILLFTWHVPAFFFYTMLVVAFVNNLEEVLTLIMLSKPVSDAKSLFFVLNKGHSNGL